MSLDKSVYLSNHYYHQNTDPLAPKVSLCPSVVSCLPLLWLQFMTDMLSVAIVLPFPKCHRKRMM